MGTRKKNEQSYKYTALLKYSRELAIEKSEKIAEKWIDKQLKKLEV